VIWDLLAPLRSDHGERTHLLASVDTGTSSADPLYRMLTDAADQLVRPCHSDGPLPATSAELERILRPVDLPADLLLDLLVATCTRDLAYDRYPVSPWDRVEAGHVLGQVMTALGPDACWWSNVDFSYAEKWEDGSPDACASDPLTKHTFSRALVGVGNNMVVTFLAVAED
jgi:hypothetical protein